MTVKKYRPWKANLSMNLGTFCVCRRICRGQREIQSISGTRSSQCVADDPGCFWRRTAWDHRGNRWQRRGRCHNVSPGTSHVLSAGHNPTGKWRQTAIIIDFKLLLCPQEGKKKCETLKAKPKKPLWNKGSYKSHRSPRLGKWMSGNCSLECLWPLCRKS